MRIIRYWDSRWRVWDQLHTLEHIWPIDMPKLPEKSSTIQVNSIFASSPPRFQWSVWKITSGSTVIFSPILLDYTVLGTIASVKPLKGYPMVDILPIADSKLNETSTGDINFLLQKSNPLFANIKKKNEISAIFSNQTQSFDNATSTFQSAGYKIIITGYVAQVNWVL